ncbi:MAG TPA: GntR family transcriptional regulator [Streptosporangiaceae bacterium]|jgi:GntR family transcriptional regulator
MRTLVAQAAAELRALLRDAYAAGDRLPPEKELAERIGVSRNTLREALGELALDGSVERRWGVGTFVRPRSGGVVVSLNAVMALPSVIRGHGHAAALDHVEIAETGCDAELAERTGFDAGARLWRVDRVFAVDGTPAVWMRDHVPTELSGRAFDPAPLADISTDMLALLRDHRGVAPSMLDGDLDAVAADAELAGLLGVRHGTPLVRIRQTCLSGRGVRLVHTTAVYRPDVVTLSVARPVRT